MAEDFAELDSFLQGQLAKLAPAQRRKVARKIGEALRRENARRIAANVQPDGSAMEPRKPRKRMKDAKGRIRRGGKMFPKIRLARSLKIRATAEEAEVSFANSLIERTASAHHFGLSDFVGRTASGKVVRARYPERQLLGVGPEDLANISELVLDLLDGV